jgi:hypothetical protein
MEAWQLISRDSEPFDTFLADVCKPYNTTTCSITAHCEGQGCNTKDTTSLNMRIHTEHHDALQCKHGASSREREKAMHVNPLEFFLVGIKTAEGNVPKIKSIFLKRNFSDIQNTQE